MFVTLDDSNHAVRFTDGAASQIGANDSCAEGGDVHFLAPNGDIHANAEASFYDAYFVGGGDFHLAAKSGGELGVSVGLSVQVDGEAHITAQANFDGCGTSGETVGESGYRLVR